MYKIMSIYIPGFLLFFIIHHQSKPLSSEHLGTLAASLSFSSLGLLSGELRPDGEGSSWSSGLEEDRLLSSVESGLMFSMGDGKTSSSGC